MSVAKRKSAGGGKLSEHVSISRQFLRSIRVDEDLGAESALAGYVCQGTARALLDSMARQLLETRQRAFTWTGPYGGGKSSLALMLASLIGSNPKLRSKARELLELPAESPILKAFHAKADGWLVVPVVGRRGSVVADIGQALIRALGSASGKRKNGDVIAELVAAAEANGQGLLLVIDELGKFLEASAQGGDDVYFFQQLAEAASRTSGNLVVVGILHQAFEAYATRLGREARDDWAKVQGRFVDIPLVAASDEVVELVGRAITVDEPKLGAHARGVADAIAKAIRRRRPAMSHGLAQALNRCWPLHPVTAALLGPISRRRFGQNERSTFGFLASREPLGFLEFLESAETDWRWMYGPARFWDFLRANLEPSIIASPDGHRWAIAVDAVERAEASGTPLHVEVAKAVALIELFRNGSGVMAEMPVLLNSIQGGSRDAVDAAVRDLVDWKILIERKHLDAFGVFAGSDFDIEGAIRAARNEIGSVHLDQAAALTNLQPVLAKRLYQERGTMRWLTRRVERLSDLENVLDKFKLDRGSHGSFILCLPDVDRSDTWLKGHVRELSRSQADLPVLLGVPDNAKRIAELSLELEAAERVLRTRAELEGDKVARNEVTGRIAAVRRSLEDELADAFGWSHWYYRGEPRTEHRPVSLSSIASELGATTYPEAPGIFSELLNRDAPSSNVVKARRDLMVRMVTQGDQPKLGYEGFPADAGLYHNLLRTPGLHSDREGQGWGFTPPNQSERGKTFERIWFGTYNRLKDADAAVSLAELYDFWREKPYGLRAGVMPVYALAFFLANRSSLALYVDGVFTPELDEVGLDEWLLDPARIRLLFVSGSEEQERLVQAVARVMSRAIGNPVAAQPLDAARALVAFVMADLPGWSTRTTKVSKPAQDLRTMLAKASDPHKVLFTALPQIFGSADCKVIERELGKIVDELKAAYPLMLDDVVAGLLEVLDHPQGEIAGLHRRATSVKGLSGDLKLDAFALRLEAYDGTPASVEGLISLANSRPPAAWVDRDIDAAMLQLSAWAVEFRRVEVLAPLRGRPSSRRVIGVVFGAKDGVDASGTVEIAEADQKQVDALVKAVLATVTAGKRDVALAAVAEAGAWLLQQSEKASS